MPRIESRETKAGTRYFIRVRDPRYLGRETQKPLQTSVVFATLPEAENFARLVEALGPGRALEEHERELEEAAEDRLDDWADKHFDALTEPSRDTVARYRRIYRSTWQPHLGHMRLSEIQRTDVAAALNKATGSDKTILNAWSVLTHMLKMAAQDGIIPRSPTVGVKPGRRTDHETEEHRYLTHEEFQRVLDATPDYWKPLIMFLAGTGCRWSEAAALEVGDVNLETAVVMITKAEKRDPDTPSRRIVGPTKTRRGRRSVTLPVEVVDALRPLMEGRARRERLFLPSRGGPLRHKTFYFDIWQGKCLRVRTKAGRKPQGEPVLSDPQPRLHDLRHSHVAWLIAAGASLPVIQARLGHEKITTTIDTYGHLLPDLQKAAAEAASLVFARTPTRPAIES